MISTIQLLDFFTETRKHTEAICSPLKVEDYVVQPVEYVSPPKWHLGHTTWFFEEFILSKHKENYRVFDPDFSYVFNSYYESVGEKVVRTNRGNLSRPTVEEIYQYRNYVTQELAALLEGEISKEIEKLVEIGIHHEKQHQELLLTDIKYILGNNPLLPIYKEGFSATETENFTQQWLSIPEGVYEIGLDKGSSQFYYDNELGKHKVYLNEFFISNKLVTNGEYLAFMEAGGYNEVLLWHAEGWDWKNQHQISAPQYWHKLKGTWHQFTLNGLQPLDKNGILTHISYYEAFAFAQWKEMRLPTEFEWEIAQSHFNWGKRWEWTESAYLPYPNYKKAPGALGEYNGKFMVNQKVLRGGSIATSNQHTRPTYRNFFHPQLRWQFNGIRLAQ